MLNKQAVGTGILSLTLLLAGICPALWAQTPTISVDTEYHTKSQAAAPGEQKKPWQIVDLSAVPIGDGPMIGWRQWGGDLVAQTWAHYDGSQGASAGAGAGSISDILGYDSASTFIGNDSDFFVTYPDPQTGVPVRDSRDFVFTFHNFMFTVPAGSTPEVLRLWTNAYACDGELDVDLLAANGNVLTSYSKTMRQPGPKVDAAAPDFFYGYWHLRFQGTAPGQTLRIHWQQVDPSEGNANLAIQAAALTIAPATPGAG